MLFTVVICGCQIHIDGNKVVFKNWKKLTINDAIQEKIIELNNEQKTKRKIVTREYALIVKEWDCVLVIEELGVYASEFGRMNIIKYDKNGNRQYELKDIDWVARTRMIITDNLLYLFGEYSVICINDKLEKSIEIAEQEISYKGYILSYGLLEEQGYFWINRYTGSGGKDNHKIYYSILLVYDQEGVLVYNEIQESGGLKKININNNEYIINLPKPIDPY